jgi:outer membrane immunogenic protein
MMEGAVKKLIVAAATVAALAAAAPAIAADPAVRRPPPAYKAPPPIWSWSGCYIGGHVGGLWARKDWIDRLPGSGSFGLSDGTHDPSGFIGGMQGGCDYQFAGGFVIGVGGDYAWTDAEGSNVALLFPPFTNHSTVESLASVTGRIGYAWDRFLGYVKGGGAWERDVYSSTDGILTGTASETRGGWTIGVGGEYAFTTFLTGFVEFNYYDFGTRDLVFAATPGGGPFHTFGIDETKSVVKAGLNLRFGGWGGPVFARY